MVLASSQISKRLVLVFRAAMDILDHVASSVDICRAEMDNVRRLNKSSRTDQNYKFVHVFARIQVAHTSMFARMSAHSQVEYLSKFHHTFSRIPSAYLSKFARMFAHNLLANLSMFA